MKDLRTRRASELDVDLDGPSDWSRGQPWDGSAVHGPPDRRHPDERHGGVQPR